MTTATLDRSAAPTVRPAAPFVPAARPVVRLTRRGRLVVLLLVVSVAIAAVLAGAASVSAATGAGVEPSDRVVVQAGQTLWELAEQVAPERDPRETIRAISQANALSSVVVVPGQSLVIPRS